MTDPHPAKPKPKPAAPGKAPVAKAAAFDIPKILAAIPEPQRLPALAFVIGQSILTGVYAAASDALKPWAMGAVVAWPFVILLASLIVYFRSMSQVRASIQDAQVSTGKAADGAPAQAKGYDLFVSAPMDALGDGASYAKIQDVVLRVMQAFINDTGLTKVYWGGAQVDSREQFDDPSTGYETVRAALEGSRHYVLIWPSKVCSSALFELGVAADRKLPTVIFHRKLEDLPYLLRGKLKSGVKDGWPVKAYVYTDLESLKRTIEVAGPNLFPT